MFAHDLPCCVQASCLCEHIFPSVVAVIRRDALSAGDGNHWLSVCVHGMRSHNMAADFPPAELHIPMARRP